MARRVGIRAAARALVVGDERARVARRGSRRRGGPQPNGDPDGDQESVRRQVRRHSFGNVSVRE